VRGLQEDKRAQHHALPAATSKHGTVVESTQQKEGPSFQVQPHLLPRLPHRHRQIIAIPRVPLAPREPNVAAPRIARVDGALDVQQLPNGEEGRGGGTGT